MMANPHRGQVTLKAGEQTYTLSLSVNALCALEDHLGRPIFMVILDMEAMGKNPLTLRIGLVRSVLWATLQDHHPDTDIDAAGEIIAAASVEDVMRAVMVAVASAMPTLAPGGKKGKAARPRAAEG